jgi:type IV pilus assembly protein PilN
MIQINLIPAKVRKKRDTARQFVSLFVLLLLVAVAAMGFLWFVNQNKIGSLERKLAQVKQEVTKYAKFEAMLKELQARKDLVDRKRLVIADLQKDRDKLARLLALLSVEMPLEKVWFEKFSQSADKFTLSGIALSNEAIAEFMRNLESSPYIPKGSVTLVLSRQVAMSNMKLREFQLTSGFRSFSAAQQPAVPKSAPPTQPAGPAG